MPRYSIYKSCPREHRGHSIYTGLVSVPGGRWPRYQIRVEGRVIRDVWGLSRRTIKLAQAVAEKYIARPTE